MHENARQLQPPRRRDDAARTRTAPPEFAFNIATAPGQSLYFKIVR